MEKENRSCDEVCTCGCEVEKECCCEEDCSCGCGEDPECECSE